MKTYIQIFRNMNTAEKLCATWAVFLTLITCAHIVFTSSGSETMEKHNWINTLNRMQSECQALRNLTGTQQEAIRDAISALRNATDTLGNDFDLCLSECRAIDRAFWAMHHAFENLEPNEHQLEQIEAHNLEWDYDTQTWSEITPDDETVDDWHPHGV